VGQEEGPDQEGHDTVIGFMKEIGWLALDYDANSVGWLAGMASVNTRTDARGFLTYAIRDRPGGIWTTVPGMRIVTVS